MKPLDRKTVALIKRLHGKGLTRREIALQAGCTPETVANYTTAARAALQGEIGTNQKRHIGVCQECDHNLDQHWLHGCRAAVMVKKYDRYEMDICRCMRPRVANRWSLVNCYHCGNLKRVILPLKKVIREVVSQKGERLKVGGKGVAKDIARCVMGIWEGFAYTQAMERALPNSESIWRTQAIDCAFFNDMRLRHDEVVCEFGECAVREGLSYDPKGNIYCEAHRAQIMVK
jgi:hypothetical protein